MLADIGALHWKEVVDHLQVAIVAQGVRRNHGCGCETSRLEFRCGDFRAAGGGPDGKGGGVRWARQQGQTVKSRLVLHGDGDPRIGAVRGHYGA